MVQTLSTHMTDAAELMLSKDVKVTISSQTPDNPWSR
jgi:hypothetical protein